MENTLFLSLSVTMVLALVFRFFFFVHSTISDGFDDVDFRRYNIKLFVENVVLK